MRILFRKSITGTKLTFLLDDRMRGSGRLVLGQMWARGAVGPSTCNDKLRHDMRNGHREALQVPRDRPTGGENQDSKESETGTNLVPRGLAAALAWPRPGPERRWALGDKPPSLALRTKTGSLALRSVGDAPSLLYLSSVMSSPWARAAEVAGATHGHPRHSGTVDCLPDHSRPGPKGAGWTLLLSPKKIHSKQSRMFI